MFKKIFALIVLLGGLAWSQPAIPFGIGASLALGQDDDHPFINTLEVEPYVQIWVLKFGLIRFGYNSWGVQHSVDGQEYSREFSTLSAEALVNLNPAIQNPYLALGVRKKKVLDDSPIGDSEWTEWSVGLGGNWLVQPGVYLYIQVDYRLSDDLFIDPQNQDKTYVDYTIFKWLFGVTVYLM